MSIFSININREPNSYARISNVKNLESCTVETIQIPIGLIGSSEINLISSYSGNEWDQLVITNITLVNNSSEIKLNNNGVIVSQESLPLIINVESLINGNIIPDLTLDVDLIELYNEDVSELQLIISFYIKSINGFIGDILTSLFKVNRLKCTNVINPIISNIVDLSVTLEQTIKSFTIIGTPDKTYSMKILYVYNSSYNILDSVLTNTDTLVNLTGVKPRKGIDNVVIPYTLNSLGELNLKMTITAAPIQSQEININNEFVSLENCVTARVLLYDVDNVTLLLNQYVPLVACNTNFDLSFNINNELQ